MNWAGLSRLNLLSWAQRKDGKQDITSDWTTSRHMNKCVNAAKLTRWVPINPSCQSTIAAWEKDLKLAARSIGGLILHWMSNDRDTVEATGKQGNGCDLKSVKRTQLLHRIASRFKFRRQTPLPHSLFSFSNPWRLLMITLTRAFINDCWGSLGFF